MTVTSKFHREPESRSGSTSAATWFRRIEVLTQEELKRHLHYDAETGVFTWLVNRTNGVKAGDKAGVLARGYVVFCLKNRQWSAHRLAFLYMEGRFPSDFIDHVNGQKDDNRWVNLREANNSENQRNRSGTGSNCGIKNVTYVRNRDKYQVSLKVDGREKFIGYFQDLELAELVALEAREKFHGPFAKHH